jgi:branched-chain amino acid aminotransferase
MIPTVYLDGRFVSGADAVVSVFDGGYLHGAGLFETMRAENGRVFRLRRHLDRLMSSAAAILVPIPPKNLPQDDILMELLQRNGLREARVRLSVSAGATRPGSSHEDRPLHACVTVTELGGHAAEVYESGAAVTICDYRVSTSDPLAGHKTTCYLPRLLGLRQAQQARCLEALWFTTSNLLAEGCMSNVFVVRNGGVKTPPRETPILPGIARSTVLELTRDRGRDAVEIPLTINDLLDADEVFLTNSIMQVVPVIRVEKHDIGEGRVGPVTREVLVAYRELVKRECAG